MCEFDIGKELECLANDAGDIESLCAAFVERLRGVLKSSRMFKKGFDEAPEFRAQAEGHLRRAEREIGKSLDVILKEERHER